MALWQMGTMRAVTQDMSGNWLPSVEHVNQLNTAVANYRIQEFKHVLNTDDKAMAGIERPWARCWQVLKRTRRTTWD